MEVIVNGTNIFIDLRSIGVLGALCDSAYDVSTVDFVVNEIKDRAQAESLASLVGEGKIKVGNGLDMCHQKENVGLMEQIPKWTAASAGNRRLIEEGLAESLDQSVTI